MNKVTITLKDLQIGYTSKKQHNVIASHINAKIYSGELTCILGTNGVGKSTLLRTLSAFQPKLDGNIYIGEKDITSFSDKALAHIIGVVLTDKTDIRNMSVEELVGMGRAPYTGFWGTYSPEDKRIVKEAINLVGISSLTHRMIETLSDGERQKVMIAKALAQETAVIYLDEPTAFLDYPSKVEVMQLLHNISREMDKTILLSTHDLELALQIADTVWLMDRQSGISIGTPEDLALDGTLSSFFARKGIAFDMNTGLFRVATDTKKQIKISGKHGTRYAMARKALLRNGILASWDIQSELSIDVLPDAFILKKGNKEHTVYTIKQLLMDIALFIDE